MNPVQRLTRHARLTWKTYEKLPSPPFLTLFINSICNQKCEHCFYWRNLNRKDDLTKDEMFALSESLGKVEILHLSGGEPFLRAEFGEICRKFVQQNGVRQIYVPTNAYFTERTVKHVTEVLKEQELDLFVAEMSLDGLGEFHNKFRGSPGAFNKAMQTYDALAEIQVRDPRLRIHAISTATEVNMDEIRRLTTYLYERCPSMDHHNLGLIRGDRKNPSLQGPRLNEYQELYEYVRRLWSPREKGRYGASIEPMLQTVKVQTARQRQQVVPCQAGQLGAVVHANGDVGVCEHHPPLGNLRQNSFWEIWKSAETNALRDSIRNKRCHCTEEISLWYSMTYQPLPLAKAMLNAKVWRQTTPLAPHERAEVILDEALARGLRSSSPLVQIASAGGSS